jgi:pentatricopeptide repeat protein
LKLAIDLCRPSSLLARTCTRTHAHTALIHTLGRGGALNEAFAVLRSMDELEPRLRPNQIIYTSLIQMSVKAGQLQRYESCTGIKQ